MSNITIRDVCVTTDQCWHEEGIGITYTKCVFVALVIQHAMHMYHICVCPALQYFSALSCTQYDVQKNVTEHKMRLLIFSATSVWNIFYPNKRWARYDTKMHAGVHVKYLLFLFNFNETGNFLNSFKKYSNIKFHENPSGGSLVIPCGHIHTWQS